MLSTLIKKKTLNTIEKINKDFLPKDSVYFLKTIKDDKEGKRAWRDRSVGECTCCAGLTTRVPSLAPMER